MVVLTINSTALDNSTGQLLNTTYTIPLNSSVTWLSVLWINKDMFSNELQIIVDGSVVQSKYFYNLAYETWKNSYSLSVFNAILYTNLNLPFTSDSTAFWNNLTTTYNLTSTKLTFIQNYHQDFIDNLTVNIVYSGVSGFNLNVTDPDNSTNVFNLNFPGNVIQRTSQVVYNGSDFEGVKSFAIATTSVNNDILGYWLDQYSNYENSSAMNTTYGTFLTALMVEYLHDQLADNVTTQYNVTWSRTNPIIVSVGEDAYETYLTLECDHSMGMAVLGAVENIRKFKFICSSAISFIEYAVMNTAYDSISQSYLIKGTFSSVTMSLFNICLNNNTESFTQNNFIIIKSVAHANEFIVIDPETGVVRDINTVNNFCGAYDIIYPLKDITSGMPARQVNYKGEIINIAMSAGTAFWWDGTGKVFLASSIFADFNTDKICADDMLIVTVDSTMQYLFADSSGVYPKSPIDITGIVQKGSNNIEVKLVDVYGHAIGCSSLALIQVISLARPHDFESANDFWNDIKNRDIQFNDKKVINLITGFMGMAGGFGMAGTGITLIGASDGLASPFGILLFSAGVGLMSYNAYNMMQLADEPWFIVSNR